jgi:hypothetical protein
MHRSLLVMSFALFVPGLLSAGTIDPNRPVAESIRPDILYFNFDEEDENFVTSHAEVGLSAKIDRGKVDQLPVWRSGRNQEFGQALEFNYGSEALFAGENLQLSGNHLRVENEPHLGLTGQSFTMGAWVQLPETADLPARPYKKIMSKGGHGESYPGWALQLSYRDDRWILTMIMVDDDLKQARGDARLPGPGLEPGNWHHVAVSFHADTKQLRIWFDGAEIYTGEMQGAIGSSNLPLVIGENGMSIYCNIPLVLDEVFITSGVHDFVLVE